MLHSDVIKVPSAVIKNNLMLSDKKYRARRKNCEDWALTCLGMGREERKLDPDRQ